jgi:uncharacterized protein (TIGR02118 family)
MVKLVVLYSVGGDAASFEQHYFGTHIPLAEALPGVQKVEVAKVDGEAAYALVAEMWFEDAKALGAAFASPAGEELRADAAGFPASVEATRLVCSVQ